MKLASEFNPPALVSLYSRKHDPHISNHGPSTISYKSAGNTSVLIMLALVSHVFFENLFDIIIMKVIIDIMLMVAAMLREVGARAHAKTFGPCPALTSSDQGPEFQ